MPRIRDTWGPEAEGLAWTARIEPAPGELRRVQAFLNTADRVTGRDELEDAAGLGRWLTRWGLASGDVAPGEAELERALEARRALRALVGAHRDGRVDSRAAGPLDAMARELPVRLRMAAVGSRVEPAGEGFAAALARLLLLVARAQSEDAWRRLKACGHEECGRVFYDYSNRRSGKWCSKRCGNRTHARAARSRRRHSSHHRNPFRV